MDPATVAVSGCGGLVGGALVADLHAAGRRVVPIRRRVAAGGEVVAWDGGEGIDAGRLRACDAVVHLAGAGIAERRWSAARRRELYDSRVRGTAAIARILAADPGRVRTLVVASAVGYHGDRGEEILDEDAAPGAGFLAGVCRDWEAACDPCRGRVRTVHLRLGVVLSTRGGALPRLIAPARWGLAGALGSGRQWWSWIALDDLVAALRHVLVCEALAGPVAAVAPQPVRQVELARAVAAALGARAWAPPVPRLVLRLLLGAMADGMLLASTRVLPRRLLGSGFTWRHATAAEAVGWALASGG